MPDAPAEPHYDIEVSVIIPALEATSHALRIVKLLAEQEQEFPFEVLLVLNHEERLVQADLPPRARILFCPEPGSFAARNAGIRAARGRVLAFTDSDCTPTSSWLREGYAASVTTNFNMVLGGRIASLPHGETPVAVYESVFYLRQDVWVARGGFAATANLWVPAPIFTKIGLFDGTMLGAGDVEFGQRALRAGFQLAYAEHAAVGHEARSTLRGLLTKERRLVGGEFLLGRRLSITQSAYLRSDLRSLRRRHQVIRRRQGRWLRTSLHFVSLAVFAVRLVERFALSVGKRPLGH